MWAIVVSIGRGHCCFDWPQATHTKLLDFARHFFTIPDFFVVFGLCLKCSSLDQLFVHGSRGAVVLAGRDVGTRCGQLGRWPSKPRLRWGSSAFPWLEVRRAFSTPADIFQVKQLLEGAGFTLAIRRKNGAAHKHLMKPHMATAHVAAWLRVVPQVQGRVNRGGRRARLAGCAGIMPQGNPRPRRKRRSPRMT